MPISPTPEARGLTHALVASIAKSHRYSPHTFIMKEAIPPVSDEVAIEWIREARDKGLDVGMPRDEDRRIDPDQ